MTTQTKTTWKKVKLGDVAEIESCGTPSSSKPEYWDNGDICWATLPDLKNKYIFDTQRKITALGLKNSSAKLLPIDSVIFSSRATIGEISITKVETSTNQGSKNFICDPKKIEYEFLYYLLKSKVDEIIGLATGATYKEINKTVFSSIEIDIPNLLTQKQIADVLSAYDDLIENNTKRIKILEEIAQAIYKEWFVYFRFPGHEKAKSRSERSSATGIKMIDSKTEFGKIPEGWEIENLGSVAENYDSKRRPVSKMKRQTMQGEIPYYGAAKIIDYVNDHIFDGKYLLLAEDGSVITKSGNPVLQFVNEKFWANNHTHILQGVRVSTEYLYLYLSGLSIQGYITGVAQPKINQDNLNRILVLVPKGEVAKKFNELAEPIFEEVWKLKETIIKLQKVRDLLLPKLVEGEIEVS